MKPFRRPLSIILTLCLMGLATGVQAQEDDAPQPDESFSSFFVRITRGGEFRGVKLEAPQNVQDSFYKKIKKGWWVGERDKAYARLQAQGVDIWNDWFRRLDTQGILFPSTEMKNSFLTALQQVLTQDQNLCAPSCPNPQLILQTPWADMTVFEKQSFVKAFVYHAPLFGGKTLLSYLAALYEVPEELATTTTQFKLLTDPDFDLAVREVGYKGPIYFRGITAPDPKNPQGHEVLLNEEMLAKGSPFEYPLERQLEVVGICVHEMSHVFQDLRGKSIGLDVQVSSAETALVIEGMAEHWAEKAMRQAGDAQTLPSALRIFVEDQATDIVYRDGNATTGNLFPYTVGLPFIASLDDLVPTAQKNDLRDHLLKVLGNQQTLQDFVNTYFQSSALKVY